jgi:hypothetical protein
MKKLTFILLLIPFLAQSQTKGKFISAGIFASSSAAFSVGAYKYSQNVPKRTFYPNDQAYIKARQQHLRTTRALYASGIITGAFSVIQLTTGAIKLIKRKNTLVELQPNGLYLTLNF